jgi:glycine cleavage system H protein
MAYPTEYKYTKEHEWVSVTDGVATVGITHHAQDQLGDIVFVELPDAGKTLKAGKDAGSVESVKAVAPVYSPLSGKVVEVNGALEATPALLNTDPHGEGWLYKMTVANPAELDGLMDAAAYDAFAAH